MDGNDSLSMKIIKTSSILSRYASNEGGDEALSSTQEHILQLVFSGKVITPIAISRLLGLSRATITQHLNYMEKEGLINKKPSRRDHRSINLRLTKKGQNKVILINSALEKMENGLENCFTPEEKKNLESYLDRIQNSLSSLKK